MSKSNNSDCILNQIQLNDWFIEEHIEELDWADISTNNKLSERFIEKWSERVNWKIISGFQKLSESFIEKHRDKVYWGWTSRYQKLSEGFIIIYMGEININNNSNLEEEVRNKVFEL